MQQILIVEDDQALNQGIYLALSGQDYWCLQSGCIESARKQFKENTVDLVLLDINLPDGSGMRWLSEIRSISQVPVIIISANNRELDIVAALESGANDYITKPFSLMVLRARVRVWLRDQKAEAVPVFQSEEYYFDFRKMEFWSHGTQVELSRTEQRLLRQLVEHPNITLSRQVLTDELWSGESEYVNEHALTVVIKRLRDKLGGNENHAYIKTVYGIGYAWISGETSG